MEWWHVFVTSKLTSEMCSVIVKEQYLGGWHCFTCLLFCGIAKFKMAATCTSYYAKNHISSPITMQIVNVIYGFTCLDGQGIWILQNKKHLKLFFATLIVKDDFKPAIVMYSGDPEIGPPMGLSESGPSHYRIGPICETSQFWMERILVSLLIDFPCCVLISRSIIKLMYWIWRHDIIKKTHKKVVLNAYKNIYEKILYIYLFL